MSEVHASPQEEKQSPIAHEVQAIFDRRAEAGDRKVVQELYGKKFEEILATLPKDKRENVAIKIQKLMITIRGFVGEYGARFLDFVRKVFLWPLMGAAQDFPKDKYYQIELARAKAWGEFAKDTTKTATNERNAFRDHFLATGVSWGQTGAAMLGSAGLVGGAMMEGAKFGAIAGLQGAAAGAVVGGALGVLYSWGLTAKDRAIGPPVVYYDAFRYMGGGGGVSIEGSIPNSPVSPVPGIA